MREFFSMVKKNNQLISLQYGFYNFLYPIQVSERYSYRKIFGRSAWVLLKEPHANSLSLTQREVKLIFNGVTLMVTVQSLPKVPRRLSRRNLIQDVFKFQEWFFKVLSSLYVWGYHDDMKFLISFWFIIEIPYLLY